MSTYPLLRFDAQTGQVTETLTEDAATHVSIGKYGAARRKIEVLERQLRQAQESNEALEARLAELENRHSRLYDKHRETLASKVHWRNRALKTEGDEPARRMLNHREEVVARDGQFWSVRVIEVEAATDSEAVLATQMAVRRHATQSARIVRIRALGGGEWVAEVLVLLTAPDAPELGWNATAQ